MDYELKRAASKSTKALKAPHIQEAKGSIIHRSDVESGGTFVVPADVSAQLGDKFLLRYKGNGIWFTWITITPENIGKPLYAKVAYVAFSEGDLGEAFYQVERVVDGSVEPAPVSVYEVRD